MTIRSLSNPSILLLLSLWPALVAGQQPRAPADSARMLDSLATVRWAEDSVPTYSQAAELWLEAVALADAGGETALAGRYLQWAARACWRAGERDRYFELMPQAIERLLAAGEPGLADTALSVLGNLYKETNQLAAARAAWRRAVSVAEDAGLRLERAAALNNLAIDAVSHDGRDIALRQVEAASEAYLVAGDSTDAFGIWRQGGSAAEERPDTVLALRLYSQALDRAQWADSVSLTLTWYRVGLLQRENVSTRDSAVQALERAFAFWPIDRDTASRAKIEMTLGETLRRAGRASEALPRLVDALQLAIASDDWPGIQGTLRVLASVQFDLGRHADVAATYGELMRQAEARRDTLVWVKALQDEGGELGSSLNAPDSALRRFSRALKLARAAGLDSLADYSVGLCVGLGELSGLQADTRRFLRADADTQLALGHPRAAAVSLFWLARSGNFVDSMPATLNLLAEADSLAGASGDSLLRSRIEVLEGQGNGTFGRPDSARVYYQRALGVLAGVADWYEMTALIGVANGWLEVGRSDSATAYGRRALVLARRRGEHTREIDALYTVGQSYRALGTPAALRQAIAYYDSATSRVADEVASYSYEVQQSVAVSRTAVLDFGAAMAWIGLAPTIGPARAARGALLAVERRRGLVVRSARERADPLPSVEQALETLRRRGGSALVFVVATASPRPTGEPLEDTVITLVTDTAGSVAGYVRAVARDTLYGILSGIPEVVRLGAADSARSGAAGLAPSAPPGRDPRGSLARLSRTILTPQVLARLRGAREIVIEPEVLTSFALFTAAPVGKEGVPFGIRYPIRFTLSLALIGDTARPSTRDTALIVGNPTMPSVRQPGGGETQLPPLAGAREEAAWVGEKLGMAPLTGDAASETEVRRLLPSASIVHLATHGLAFKSLVEPRAPFIALAPDSANDGLLSLREILDDPALRLRADLVVLSACQTGLGNPGDEGLNGLQRAFLLRGARSVIYSLWSVSDEATRLFMEGFYRHWLDDPDHPGKSESLRLTRADLRRIPRFHAPYYWAAFQLLGAD